MGALHRLESPTGATSVYVASPLGFTEPTRQYYESVLLPALRTAGLSPLDPWENDDPAIAAHVAEVDAAPADHRLESLRKLNGAIGSRNIELLERADIVLAVLDGVDVDSGTAAEIGFAAARATPIIGLRTDQRQTGENEGCSVNLQVEHFILTSGGAMTTSLSAALDQLRAVASTIPSRAGAGV
jgi:nucleoside 2-deoxyribosyltransferase